MKNNENNHSATLLDIKSLLRGYKRGMRLETLKRHLGFNDEQYARLRATGVLEYNTSGASIKGLKVSYPMFADTLEISLCVIKNRTPNYYGKHLSSNNRHLIFEFDRYGLDWDFILTAAYQFAKGGLDSAHDYFLQYRKELDVASEKKRAESLDMSHERYQERKKAGIVDWEYGKIYALERVSQDVGCNFFWRYEGSEYRLRNASLYWSSQKELFHKFKNENPSGLWESLGALYKELGESTGNDRIQTTTRTMTEREKENKRRAEVWDEIYREEKKQNEMFDRAYR